MSNGGISGISVIDWRIFFHSKGMGICTRSDTGHTSDPQSMVVVITQTSSDSQCMGLACETVLKWVDGSLFCWIIIFIQGAVKYIMILLLPIFCCSIKIFYICCGISIPEESKDDKYYLIILHFF